LKAAEGEVSSVARYEFRAGPPPNIPVAAGAGSGGGDMDDVLRRLGMLEGDVSVIKTEVAAMAAQLPNLATKADVEAVKTEVAGIAAQLPNMASKEDLMAVKVEVDGIAAQLPHLATKAVVDGIAAQLPHLATKAVVDGIAAQLPHLATKADLNDWKTSIIQWMIGTVIAMAALAFTAARFIH
jgi:hypothetical protein